MVNPTDFLADDAAPAPSAHTPAPAPAPDRADTTGQFAAPIALMPLKGLAGVTDTGEGVCGPDGCF